MQVRIPGITISIIIILVICFFLQNLIPGLTEKYIFLPSAALSRPWLFISSIFLHANITHIFFNCFSLFLFGSVLERRLSVTQYVTLFLLAGLAGSILYWFTWAVGIIPDVPALGASGAIFGILGACAVLFPTMTVYVYFFPLNIRHAAVLWFFLEFMGVFDISSGIASAGHLGGLLIGMIYAWFLVRRQEPEIPAWAR